MRILPVNNGQNKQNQTNFKARAFDAGATTHSAEELWRVVLDTTEVLKNNCVVKILNKSQDPKEPVIQMWTSLTFDNALKVYAKVSQAFHDALYGNGPNPVKVDLTDIFPPKKE